MKPNKINFIEVVKSNQGTIRSLCNAYYVHYEDQKDVFQDIVLQLWKSFETFRGESEINTWIYRVSLNTILTKIRNEKKNVITEPISNSDLTFSSRNADDYSELLQMVLHSLTGIDKAIVILFLEGYKNKEMSEILNLTPTNVSTRLNRVKAVLKVRFKNQYYEFKQP